MSQWSVTLSAAEIEEAHKRAEVIDPLFAVRDRAFYQSRTIEQLSALTAGAWEANDATGYQMARSYWAVKAEENRKRRIIDSNCAIALIRKRRRIVGYVGQAR